MQEWQLSSHLCLLVYGETSVAPIGSLSFVFCPLWYTWFRFTAIHFS
jgi:hypothetical protein